MADPSPRLSQTVAGTGVIRRLDWAGCPGRHGHVAAVGAVVGGGAKLGRGLQGASPRAGQSLRWRERST